MEQGIQFKEVYDTIKTSPNGKAPGPDGIPNEFWKAEMSRRNQMKKQERLKENLRDERDRIRPCIAALMTKIRKDIEIFGPINTQFTEARMGLLYKKKIGGKYKTTDPSHY